MVRPRSSRSALFRLFDGASTPVYALDDRRRIIYCNGALADWLQADVEQLLGKRCDYHTELDADASDALVAGLCPPPGAFAGSHGEGVVACRQKDGTLRRRRADFVSLGDQVANCVGVVGVVRTDDLIGESRQPITSGSTPKELHEQVIRLRAEIARQFSPERLVGHSAAMRLVRDQVAVAARSLARSLVIGPAGSGREHVARMIHYSGGGATAPPLVPLDCSLLDAELLGTTIAAFLKRCAELETEGVPCLLLLEVDQLPRDAQADLLGVLRIQELDLRTIATSRCGLLHTEFNEQLASLISTVVIELPSLSDRLADVPLLLQYFVEQQNAKGGTQLEGVSQDAIDQLLLYPWPGNLDELIEVVNDAFRRAEGLRIMPAHLPKHIRLGVDAAALPVEELEKIQLDEFLADIERELMRRALAQTKGNKAGAARLLGVSRARLLRRIAQLSLDDGVA